MACAIAGLAIIGIMGYLALDFSARALAWASDPSAARVKSRLLLVAKRGQ